METVKFYFSFRSPFAWLAFHRYPLAFGGLPVTVQAIPVFPPPGFANDPTAVPAKGTYVIEDAARIAQAYGLRVQSPTTVDTDWMRPHAAYLHAADQNRAEAFGAAVFAARFSEGRDIGTNEVLADLATACGLDAAAVVAAAGDPSTHARVMEGMAAALADRIFGVPTFIYRGQRFWGNDRIEWLLRAIRQDLEMAVPDLASNPLAPPV